MQSNLLIAPTILHFATFFSLLEDHVCFTCIVTFFEELSQQFSANILLHYRHMDIEQFYSYFCTIMSVVIDNYTIALLLSTSIKMQLEMVANYMILCS